MAPRALSAVESAGLGMFAGAIEVCVMQPTIFLKNTSQQGMPIGSHLLRQPAMLYRGLGMSVGNMAVLTGELVMAE